MGRIALAALLGVARGFGASASNAWPSALLYVLNAGWAWAGVLVLGGLCARKPLGGMITALVAGACANTAYFLGDSWWAGASQPGVIIERDPFVSSLPELSYWILVALILAPGLGSVGAWQRRPDLTGLLAVLIVPVGASLEMLLPRRWPETNATGETIVRWLVWIASAVIVSWAIRRYIRWRSRKKARSGASQPHPARSQVAVTAVLVSLSLAIGIGYVVFATGVLNPAQRGVGLTEAQQQASIIARAQVIHDGTDTESATVTMTRNILRDPAAPPALEFEINESDGIGWQTGNEYVVFLIATNPPGGYDLISGSHAAIPISEQNTVPVSLPDWLDSSLNIRSP